MKGHPHTKDSTCGDYPLHESLEVDNLSQHIDLVHVLAHYWLETNVVKWDMETYPPQQLGESVFTCNIDLFSFKTTPSNVWDPTFENRLVQSAYGFIALFYSRLGQLGFTTFFHHF